MNWRYDPFADWDDELAYLNGLGTDCVVTPVEPTTWGRLKASYRADSN
ncbi:hypothetical protein K8I85_06540 [bacterium]|nr:hypothetical protein [bacterium]